MENLHRKEISEPVTKAMEVLRHLKKGKQEPIPFTDFMGGLSRQPFLHLRTIFQHAYDLVKKHATPIEGELVFGAGDVNYDLSGLLVDDLDRPFYADQLFQNRFFQLVERLRDLQQNRIFLVEGGPGSGKTLFLSAFLDKMQRFAGTDEGRQFEVIWRLDKKELGVLSPITQNSPGKGAEKELESDLGKIKFLIQGLIRSQNVKEYPEIEYENGYAEIPCPSHCHPITLIPKQERRAFLNNLITDEEIKKAIFTDKEFTWVFHDKPCPICSFIYKRLRKKMEPVAVLEKMVYVQSCEFDRQLGVGISVWNPGDKDPRETVMRNPMVQQKLNRIFRDSRAVPYLYSLLASTNNGIRALMDVKDANKSRFLALHNIVSDGVTKVEETEEQIRTLFLVVANPEDLNVLNTKKSLASRVTKIYVPYIRDPEMELKVYGDELGDIFGLFLPEVAKNFARIIVSSRISVGTHNGVFKWISDPGRYSRYVPDSDLLYLILKMELYSGNIPDWLSQEDRKDLTPKKKKRVVRELDRDGRKGFSGRDSIRLFSDFLYKMKKKVKDGIPITMEDVIKYFKQLFFVADKEGEKKKNDYDGDFSDIPPKFLSALTNMYDFHVFQQIEAAMYNYNADKIEEDILDYIFAVQYDVEGQKEINPSTGNKVEISENFLREFEIVLLGKYASDLEYFEFRRRLIKRYSSETVAQEIQIQGKKIRETRIFLEFRERVISKRKEGALDLFTENENFTRAIKDYGKPSFFTYDRRIQEKVNTLFKTLQKDNGYTEEGVRQVFSYFISRNIVQRFGTKS